MKNYNWEYFKVQIIKSFRTKTKSIYSQEKLMWSLFWIYEAILGFTRMSVRGINKSQKRTRICANGT